MKKKLTILLLIFLSAVVNTCFALDYSSMCTAKPFKKSFSGILSSTAGVNFLTKKTMESAIERALKKEINSKFDVKIQNFYGVSLLGGNFGNVNVKSDNIFYNGFYFSSFNAQTVCPYNSVDVSNDSVVFRENMILKYTTVMSEDDLQKSINTDEYKEVMAKINGDNVLSKIINIKEPKIKIKEDNIYFEYEVSPAAKIGSFTKNFIKPLKVSMKAKLEVVDGVIQLSDIEVNDSKLSKYMPIEQALKAVNPLSFSFKADDNNGKLKIDDVKIENSQVKIVGYLIIPKNKA